MIPPLLLGSIDAWTRGLVETAGYVGLVAVLAIESIFPPIPSEVVLPLAGFEVSRGTFTFLGALIAATIGSLVGALVLYGVGRFGGRRAITRLARAGRINDRQIEAAERWFDRRGWAVVLFGRLVPGLRSLVSIPAGARRMDVVSFSLLTVVGSAAWNAALIGAGYGLGARWSDVSGVVSRASTFLLVAVFILGAVASTYFVRRGRRLGG